MITLTLLAIAPAWAQCPGNGTVRDLSRALAGAEYAAVQRDSASFAERWGEARGRLPCLEEPLTEDLAWTVYALDGLDVALHGDLEGAVASFSAARSLYPEDPPPEWLGHPGTKLEQRWQAASGLEPTWDEVRVDRGLEFSVDGLEAERLPANRPALVQLVEDGFVVATALVRPGGALPEGLERVVPEPPAPEPAPPVATSCDLTVATEQLKAGRYEEALDTALLSIPTCPEQAATYQVVASIATERLEARRAGGLAPAPPPPPAPAAPAPATAPAPAPAPTPEPTAAYDSWAVDDPPPPPGEWEVPGDDEPLAIPMGGAADAADEREPPEAEEEARAPVEGEAVVRDTTRKLRLGVEAGTLLGGRLEQDRGEQFFTAWGARAGGLFFRPTEAGLELAPMAAGFADLRLSKKWQIEGSTGFLIKPSGGGALLVGAALQYDPPSPFFVNIGGWAPTSGQPAWDLTLGMVF